MRWLAGCLLVVAACSADEASCPMTVDAFCANGACPRTWAAAQDAASWGAECTYGRVALAACADGHVALDVRLDDGFTFYYNATGTLYRIEHNGMTDNGKCEAGGGAAKVCSNEMFHTLCGTGP